MDGNERTIACMARPLHVEFPGVIYHVMTHSNQGALLFRSASQREPFLSTLREMAAKTHVPVHAYYRTGNAGNLSRCLFDLRRDRVRIETREEPGKQLK